MRPLAQDAVNRVVDADFIVPPGHDDEGVRVADAPADVLQQGAMGQHYLNEAFAKDGNLEISEPEALMYEFSNGRARLVGVEFIVDAATWLAAHDNEPPSLEGQAFHLVDSPNRYATPAFFELHVWAWRFNPNGAFVDWNTEVSCEGQ